MPLPVITNTFRVGVVQQVTGVAENLVNVIHVHTGGGLSETDVAEAVEAAWGDNISAIQSSNLNYIETDVLELNGTSGTLQHTWTGATTTGTHGANEMEGLQVCAIWTLRTGLAGRSHRGRMFISGLQRSQVDQNTGHQLDGGSRTAMQTAADGFVADLAATSTDLVVASYALASESLVTSILVRPYLGTQRRRVNNN